MTDLLIAARERKKRMELKSSGLENFISATEDFLQESSRQKDHLARDFDHLDEFIQYGERILDSAAARLDALRREARRADSFISYAEHLLKNHLDSEPDAPTAPVETDDAAKRSSGGGIEVTQDYFTGEWQMVRIIENVREGVLGEFWGVATFTPDDEGLTCREDGMLRFGGEDHRTGGTLLWRFSNDGRIEVCYEDGRPFHSFLTRDPIARSIDGEVESRIRYEFEADTWLSTWELLAPDREYVMTTRYTR